MFLRAQKMLKPLVSIILILFGSIQAFVIKGHIEPDVSNFGNFSLDGLLTRITIEDISFQDEPSKLLNEKLIQLNKTHMFPLHFDINYTLPNNSNSGNNVLTLRASIKTNNETLVFLTTSSFILTDDSIDFEKPFKLKVSFVGNPCKMRY